MLWLALERRAPSAHGHRLSTVAESAPVYLDGRTGIIYRGIRQYLLELPGAAAVKSVNGGVEHREED